jgi:phosphopantetheine adenylyltransferase
MIKAEVKGGKIEIYINFKNVIDAASETSLIIVGIKNAIAKENEMIADMFEHLLKSGIEEIFVVAEKNEQKKTEKQEGIQS